MLEKEPLFWFCALAGSGLFLIQFLFSLIGVDGEEGEAASAHNFKWLSKQALTGFLMMFGWVGLACKKELGYTAPVAACIAALSGAVAMFITGSIFRLSRKLRSTGTVFRIEEAIGKEASVYLRIPKGGTGKISISLQNLTHEIDAIALNGEEIDSFTRVQIINKANERTVVVAPMR
jgi:hypothetical protein